MATHQPLTHTLRTTTLRLHQTHHSRPTTRPFSSSPPHRKHGPLPTFSPTSSPDLDTLLTTFRTNIFLPSHLLRAQRALIYRRSLQHQLTGEDPITITLPTASPTSRGSEAFTLSPLDHLRDEPATAPSFNTLLSLLRTKSDWHVLPFFLEGLRTSGRKLSSALLQKMVRRAAAAGQMGLVGECARMVARTGVRLDEVGLAREGMWGAVQTAVLGGWSAEATAAAARQAEGLLVLMEDPAHVVENKSGSQKGVDPRKAPEVLGVGMALMALRALKSGEGDAGGKVERWAKRTLDCWRYVELGVREGGGWWDANRALMWWAPVQVGMKAAVRVLGEGSELGTRLGGVLSADVEPVVRRARDVLEREGPKEGRRRGMVMYEEMWRALV
ncbi:hypothetical protein MMC34_005305 [Xylographa carneopallida]|nr:hypothetical protein [Xylographa carneopallida]